MSSSRLRLDHVLVDRGLAPTRSRARALIMAGKVRLPNQPECKAGTLVSIDAAIEVIESPRFVSRGGDKLAAAINKSGINVTGGTCLDIGASTGGFTDALLQAGASTVISVDVGYGQFHWKLRQDDRVFVLERINARYLTIDDLPPDLNTPPMILVIDVAFISVRKILPAVGRVCAPACDAIVLVKPQFESSPDRIGKRGILTGKDTRRECLIAVGESAEGLGWSVIRAIPSPIRGSSGNWECFLQLQRPRLAAEFASLQEKLENVEIPEN